MSAGGRSVSTAEARRPSGWTVKPAVVETAYGVGRVGHPHAGRTVPAPQELVDLARGEHPAVADDRHRGAHLLDLGEDVGAEQDRHAGLAEGADRVADLADAGRVEAVGRLVEDQQLRGP